MARLNKKGLVYFPLEVNFFADRKIRKLNIRTNFVGSQIYIYILSLIYQNSYYIETSIEDLAEDIVTTFADKDIFNLDFVEKIIQTCIDVELFDKELSKKGIFTSKGIQKQYLLSTKRRKGVDTTSYWILDIIDEAEVRIKIKESECNENVNNNEVQEEQCKHNVDNNLENVYNNSNSAYNNSQSKSKRKKKKDKTDKIDKTNLYGLPKLHYLTKALIENGYIDDFCLDIPKFNSLFDELCSVYDFENVCIATNYLIKYSSTADPPIDYPYAFFSKSITSTLKFFYEEAKHANETFEEWIKRKFGNVEE